MRGPISRHLRRSLLLSVLLVAAGSACSRDSHPASDPAGTTAEPRTRSYGIADASATDTIGHDAAMYTQGLCFYDGDLYESSGGYASSLLRRIDYPSMAVLDEVTLPQELFAEGVAILDDTLFLLTWREGVALKFSLPGLEECGAFEYAGEGWGLTASDSVLFMSDGSGVITVRDPATFAPLRRMQVTVGGSAASLLNELEFRDGIIYANQWGLETVLAIDAATGRVLTVIDASGLLDRNAWPSAEVLNGIAFDPEGRMILTGKHWPFLFAVTY